MSDLARGIHNGPTLGLAIAPRGEDRAYVSEKVNEQKTYPV